MPGRTRALREQRKANGDCIDCGRERAVLGQVRCVHCGELHTMRCRRFRARRRDAGLCQQCGLHPTVPGRTRCARCLTYQGQWMALKRARPAVRALPPRVPEPPVTWREVRDATGAVIGVTAFHGRELPRWQA